MKKMRTHLLSAAILIALICAIPNQASACCTVCFGLNKNDCYEFESNCTAICCECSCVNSMIIHYDPKTDYILASPGKPAYIVNGGTKIKIGSDNLAAFMATMNAKYASAKRDDPKIKKEISIAWNNFFKRPDDGGVSAKRLAAFCKETGLKIRTN